MKTIKRIAALALCLALVCSLLPGLSLRANAETYSGICGAEGDGSNLTWTLDTETGVLTIEGSGAMKDYDSGRDIPWYAYRTSVTSLRIAQGVTGIGKQAFSDCYRLRVLNLPEGLTSIGIAAFLRCEGLTAVTLPGSLTSIGDNAFFVCPKLRVVTIPASVQTIGFHAFGYSFGYSYETGTVREYKVEGFTVCGYPGTIAKTYATEEGFRFIAADHFSDVTSDNYFFNAVMWAISHDPVITAGVDENLFGAVNPCTREQIVTFLWAANGKPEPEGTGTTFSDVSADAWYYKPVAWAVENGITSGMGDGSFGVGQSCTRAQAMTFLWAAKGKPAPETAASPFSDVSEGDWYYDAVLWAYENEVTAGMGDGSFGANSTCTRAQIITFLYKAYVTLQESAYIERICKAGG